MGRHRLNLYNFKPGFLLIVGVVMYIVIGDEVKLGDSWVATERALADSDWTMCLQTAAVHIKPPTAGRSAPLVIPNSDFEHRLYGLSFSCSSQHQLQLMNSHVLESP